MNYKIGIIGFGSMGRMIFEKLISSKIVQEGDIYIANRTYEKIREVNSKYPEVNVCRRNTEAAENSAMLFLCVKPLELKSVLHEICTSVSPETHIVSLNGSVQFEQLEMICRTNKISKVIPSVTAEVNLSQTLVCHNKNVQNSDKEILASLLSVFGNVIELPEHEIGIGSELVSCMPGFIAALFDEICLEAKKHTQISDDDIAQMVKSTLYGTSKLMLEKKLSFEEVVQRVATKGGITEEGTKIIHEQFPKTVSDIFAKTIEKRKITTEKAVKQF